MFHDVNNEEDSQFAPLINLVVLLKIITRTLFLIYKHETGGGQKRNTYISKGMAL